MAEPTHAESGGPASAAEVLDKEAFGEFCDLLGAKTPSVLARYIETTRGYFDSLNLAFAARNFNAMFHAVHPLKSASQQVGATAVALLAEDIENMCMQEAPDPALMESRIHRLGQAMVQAETALHHLLARL